MIKSDYYMWLLSKVDNGRGITYSYSKLLDFLFSCRYEYAFEMDSNRAKAGESLRALFAMESGLYLEDVMTGDCTVLEMLIALSDYLAFNTDSHTDAWFWKLIDNLGLNDQRNDSYDENYISSQVYKWMNHDYEPDGEGSLFPLKDPHSDCRNMEVWDQMNAYLVENYPIGNWME